MSGIVAVAAIVTSVAIAQAAGGEAVYTRHCAMCHNAMSPKLGDKAAWAPLIKGGTDALVATTLKGKGVMPPQRSVAGLTEADVKAAVEYMESKAQ